MRIEIEIPKEFEKHFKRDKFKDSLERIMVDIKHSLESRYWLCAGRYEHETIEMLEKAFEDSKQAYDIDKVVEDLELHSFEFGTDTLPAHYVRLNDAIEIVKQGSVADDVCEWKVFDNSLTDEPQWVYGTTCGKYVEEEHTSKAFGYCPYCGKKIKVME